MKQWLKYTIIVTLLLLGAALFYTQVYVPKTTFETLPPTQGDLSIKVRGIGNVGAKNIYNITAQSGGKILAITVDEGSWVKKGDLLVSMDGVDLSAQLAGAQASREKAKYDIVASRNELKNLMSQKELLQKTYNRYEKLNKQGYAAQSEYDKALSDVQGIKTQIAGTRSHINAAKAETRRAQKNMEALQTRIERLNVYSPSDGYVISKDAEVAQNVLPTMSILKIVDPKTLWVVTKIDERICSKVRKGQSAEIQLHSQPNKTFVGYVKRIHAMSDAVTLEREIDVAFKNIPEPFYINEQAEVSIEVKRYTEVLKIPSHVVVQVSGQWGVWRVKEGKVYFLILKDRIQNGRETSASNLSDDLTVIVPNSKKKTLKEGMKIHL